MDRGEIRGYKQLMVKFCTTAFVALIAGALTTSSFLANLSVLCVGSDGHVAMESSVAGFCNDYDDVSYPSPAGHDSEAVGLSGESEHCGSCDDYSIFNESQQQSRGLWGLLNSLSLHMAIALPADSNAFPGRAPAIEPLIPRAPPQKSKVLTFLSTVVILS